MTLMETVGASRCVMALMSSQTHKLKPLNPFQINDVVSTPLTSTIFPPHVLLGLAVSRREGMRGTVWGKAKAQQGGSHDAPQPEHDRASPADRYRILLRQ